MMRLARTPALAAALAVASLAFGLAACGEEHSSEVVEGEPIELGELRFNVQLTRFLNIDDREDAEYLEGLPAPEPDTSYLAVFMEVENEGDDPVVLPSEEQMEVRDTTDAVYEPVATESVFGFSFGETLEGGEQVPLPDTAAASGPVQGQVAIFHVSDDVSENRPLELEIEADGENGVVELDI